jgi:MFS transporter, DHA2 family, multidrug resistance protein
MVGRDEETSFRNWVAVFGAILGAFMAVLDIQIVNASLEYIQGGLSASLDQGTWISTAYLVGEIITIPLTGWLSEVFSTRRYLIGNCILFLGFSMLCGLSTNLGMMIVCRAGQGFTGGVFIPMAMTIVLRYLPLTKRSIGLALFGVTATFAPAIGPTIGGFLTDTYSWHWIFYINVIPGLLLIWAIAYGLDGEKTNFQLLRDGDWAGIICMAIGLGSLITMLEEGERKDWFGDPLIRDTAIAAAIFIPAFIAIELMSKRPFINLRLLKQASFASSSTMGLLLGLGLYGTVYVLPVYLAQIQGYDAMQIGEVIMWLGLPQLLLFPFVPLTMRYVDSRVMVGFGLALFAISCFMDAYMTHDWAIQQLRWSQLVRAAGQPFVIVPLSGLAAGSQPASEQANASAIFNIMRNLGGSIGIAMLSTFITFREHSHFSVIGDALTQNSLRTSTLLNDYSQALAAKTPAGVAATHMQALAEMAGVVRREAFVMAYSDCFFIMGISLALCILALLLVKKPPEDAPAAAG